MAKIFQLGGDRRAKPGDAADSPFQGHGYDENPFPDPHSPMGKAVFYHDHMEPELSLINDWLKGSQSATQGTLRPLAIRGSIGVGKTLLLKTLESGLEQEPGYEVVRKSLTDEGQTKLLLSSLLLGSLPGGQAAPSATPPSALLLLDRLATRAQKAEWRPPIDAAILSLGPESTVRQGLSALFGTADPREAAQLRQWLARWLTRAATTATQRAKLHLSSSLEGEGQAIRAITDLLRVARAAGLLSVWFVFIDQLEDLWRPGVVTPGRRARFLTDLRLLIDLAAEGAPVAVLVAWNTAVSLAADAPKGQREPLEQEYRALWRRLGKPIDLPGLRDSDLWPFAEAYLAVAPVLGPPQTRSSFRKLLHSDVPVLAERLSQDGEARIGERFVPYRVLQQWRLLADELARRSERAVPPRVPPRPR